MCFYKGLTDKMRKDSNIMKDLSTHTRLNPDERKEHLNRFITNIQQYVFRQCECLKVFVNSYLVCLDLKCCVYMLYN